jgi:hypothetical protein
MKAGMQTPSDASRSGGLSVFFRSMEIFNDPLTKMLEMFRDVNPEEISCSPRIDLRIDKMHTCQKTLPTSQIQCHAHIPEHGKALIFISNVQDESFGLRILETAAQIF